MRALLTTRLTLCRQARMLAAVSAAGFDLLAKRLTDALQGQTSPRAARLRTSRRGESGPLVGGYLTGPDDHRPTIEIAAAEMTKVLLADAIAHGAIPLFLIADIDSPRGGIIRVLPQNLISLSQLLKVK